MITLFQSTLPVKGATYYDEEYTRLEQISIHAPREGSDSGVDTGGTSPARFQSTLPVKGATLQYCATQVHKHISIHAPREGSDSNVD